MSENSPSTMTFVPARVGVLAVVESFMFSWEKPAFMAGVVTEVDSEGHAIRILRLDNGGEVDCFGGVRIHLLDRPWFDTEKASAALKLRTARFRTEDSARKWFMRFRRPNLRGTR